MGDETAEHAATQHSRSIVSPRVIYSRILGCVYIYAHVQKNFLHISRTRRLFPRRHSRRRRRRCCGARRCVMYSTYMRIYERVHVHPLVTHTHTLTHTTHCVLRSHGKRVNPAAHTHALENICRFLPVCSARPGSASECRQAAIAWRLRILSMRICVLFCRLAFVSKAAFVLSAPVAFKFQPE